MLPFFRGLGAGLEGRDGAAEERVGSDREVVLRERQMRVVKHAEVWMVLVMGGTGGRCVRRDGRTVRGRSGFT